MNTTTVPASRPYRFVEDGKYAIYNDPRISAAQLAELAVADHSRQETIMKNAKRAKVSVVSHYNRLRGGFKDALTSEGINATKLLELALSVRAESEKYAQEAKDGKTWNRDVCLRNADAIECLATITDLIPCPNASVIPRPREGYDHLMISGVRVSVQPIFIFSTIHRKKSVVGAVMLHTGKADDLALSKGPEGMRMGDYLGALVYRLLETHIAQWGQPARSFCSVIDVYRSEVHQPPQNYKTLFKNMEAACRSIRARWESLPGALEKSNAVEDSEVF